LTDRFDKDRKGALMRENGKLFSYAVTSTKGKMPVNTVMNNVILLRASKERLALKSLLFFQKTP
jgi:S-adenosylmethionine synthetase